MITQTTVFRREIIRPTTPTERQVFSRVNVAPEGAVLILQLSDFVVSVNSVLVIATSAQAAVLEELGRMLRIRLREQEQAGLARDGTREFGGRP